MSGPHSAYYLPAPSHWPIIGSIGLFLMFGGAAMLINEMDHAAYVMGTGFLTLVIMLCGWFGTVIRESEGGHYNEQVDKSFRWGMFWFIFSEIMFFAAFFGALFYARFFAIPWLGGEGEKLSTHAVLWPAFEALWPLLKLPDAKGFTTALEPMRAWGLPAVNTFILLSSGATVTWAHWGLKQNKRLQLVLGFIPYHRAGRVVSRAPSGRILACL